MVRNTGLLPTPVPQIPQTPLPKQKWVFTDPDFQGIEAAWKRAVATPFAKVSEVKKAIADLSAEALAKAEAKAAELEPVVAKPQKQDAS